jgi:hypothetical protein
MYSKIKLKMPSIKQEFSENSKPFYPIIDTKRTRERTSGQINIFDFTKKKKETNSYIIEDESSPQVASHN